MCGIAGWISAQPQTSQQAAATASKLSGQILSRGPDGQGQAFACDFRVGFVHSRLAIIDPRARSDQPLHDPVTGSFIAFNGEIYNFRALRTELSQSGVAFATDSDTEVILQGYLKEGIDFFSKLRGMYAFAIYDPRARIVIAVRDPLGIKPLYVSCTPDRVVFGSSPSTVAILGEHRLDEAAAVSLAVIGAVLEPLTPYVGVRQAPPGTALSITFHGNAVNVSERKIEPAPAWTGGHRRGGIGALGAALADSVSAHFTSDVPVAVFQSAGLDSTLLSTLARREGYRPVLLTIGFDEFRNTPMDEVSEAADVARRLDLDHRYVYFNRAEFEALGERFLTEMATPTADGFNTYIAAWFCREQGFKVVLSGVGGDEIFAGYPSFRQLPMLNSIGAAMKAPGIGPLARKACEWVGRASPRRSPKLQYMGNYISEWNRRYLFRRAYFVPEELPQVLHPDVVEAGLPRFMEAFDALSSPSISHDTAGVRRLELDVYMRNVLLRDADWAGMAHGVEIRTPFVDMPLLRQLCDDRYRCLYHKDDLRRLAGQLDPDMNLKRREKTGFMVPHHAWSVNSEKIESDPLTFGSKGPRAWNKRVLEHWFKDWVAA